MKNPFISVQSVSAVCRQTGLWPVFYLVSLADSHKKLKNKNHKKTSKHHDLLVLILFDKLIFRACLNLIDNISFVSLSLSKTSVSE